MQGVKMFKITKY